MAELMYWVSFVFVCLFTGLCCVLGSRLKMNLGRHCWTNTGGKQKNWKGKRVQSLRDTVVILCLTLSVLSFLFCINKVFCFWLRKVEQGQQTGVPLDSTSLAQSSQYLFIQSKPDYHSLLCRQQPMLHTVEMIVSFEIRFFTSSLIN